MYTEVYKPIENSGWSLPTERSVLVVEDDEAILESVATVLREEGFLVYEATNGAEALRFLQSRRLKPNLILLDMIIPLMGGAEFLAVMEQEPDLKDVPVALLSASRLDSVSPLAVANLAKPVEIEVLLYLVHRYADQPAAGVSQRLCC
jgi:two-component system, chemotaxis family, chemotaxis protein CheY